jgi:23S rRNA (uridine2552-2'-O)-methyltransferase
MAGKSGGRGLGNRSVRHDPAYLRAKKEKYAGRAVYKLEELDQKFRLFKHKSAVLDLGCWPGSWLQYVVTKVSEESVVVGVDLKEVEIALPGHVETFVGDVFKIKPEGFVDRFGHFTVVISDMAPNTTGEVEGDVFRSEELFLRALEIARGTLRPGGHFAAKVFQGERFPELLREVKATFQEGRGFHTKNTRRGSRERYIVGRGLRPTKRS